MPTVTWDDPHGPLEGHRFPSVALDRGVIWTAHHSCSERTSWLDGHLVGHFNGNDMDEVLDIVAIDAPDKDFEHDSFDLPTLRAQARKAWDAGGVLYIGEGALVVPVSDLTLNDVIAEAISRFRP